MESVQESCREADCGVLLALLCLAPVTAPSAFVGSYAATYWNAGPWTSSSGYRPVYSDMWSYGSGYGYYTAHPVTYGGRPVYGPAYGEWTGYGHPNGYGFSYDMRYGHKDFYGPAFGYGYGYGKGYGYKPFYGQAYGYGYGSSCAYGSSCSYGWGYGFQYGGYTYLPGYGSGAGYYTWGYNSVCGYGLTYGTSCGYGALPSQPSAHGATVPVKPSADRARDAQHDPARDTQHDPARDTQHDPARDTQDAWARLWAAYGDSNADRAQHGLQLEHHQRPGGCACGRAFHEPGRDAAQPGGLYGYQRHSVDLPWSGDHRPKCQHHLPVRRPSQPGTYYFRCSVDPAVMKGQFVVH